MLVTNKTTIAAILITLLVFNPGRSDWIKKTVGAYNTFFDLKIGDGRNDGVQRVYCGCADGHIVEWTFNCSKNIWDMVVCGKAESMTTNTIRMLWIGDGRGDGLNRIYGASANERKGQIGTILGLRKRNLLLKGQFSTCWYTFCDCTMEGQDQLLLSIRHIYLWANIQRGPRILETRTSQMTKIQNFTRCFEHWVLEICVYLLFGA